MLMNFYHFFYVLISRNPLLPQNTTDIHDVPDDSMDAIDYCFEQGWTDGLPVIPPRVDRVDQMLLYEGRPAETVIALSLIHI